MAKTMEPSGRTATLADVAQRAGVSPGMVSLTLSGKRKGSPAIREAILNAVQELNYSPDPHAQRLARGRSDRTVGLFVLSLDLGVMTQTIQQVEMLLRQQGFEVPLYGYGLSEENRVDTLRALRRQKPIALICQNQGVEKEVVDELHRFQSEGGQLLCYGQERFLNMECDEVLFDSARNVERAVQYLIELGHRKIGFRVHSGQPRPDSEIVKAFRRTLLAAALEVRDEWIFGGGWYEDGGAAMAGQFLAMAPEKRPTAVCIINDVSASAFVNTLLREGLKVPDDVSVMGYDDMPAARHCIVPLTTISHPVKEVARQIVQLVLSRFEGDYQGPGRQVAVCGQIIERASTRSHG